MILFFCFIIAVFVTMVLIPPLMRSSAWLRVVDLPDARKVHTEVIPRIGGVAMVAGALLPMVMWLTPHREIIGFVVGIIVILFFGVWDDRQNLDYRLKFLGQIIAVLIVVLYGGVVIKFVPFWGVDPLPSYVGIPLTVFALLGITNAINLADGLDGLAGGTTLLSLGMVAVMAYMADGMDLMVITVSVMGSILGFLRYNTYPASIFMGDGGSQFLGFSVGVLVIRLTQDVNPALSPAVAIMILGLPILDTLMVMGQRIYERRSPFSPDRNHIHHKLLVLGFDHYHAVFLIYLVQSILVFGAYFLRFQSDSLIIGLYLLFCAAVIVFFQSATRAGWHVHAPQEARQDSLIRRGVLWLREDQRLLKVAHYFAAIAITLYFLLVAMFVSSVPRDIGVLAWWLLGVLLVLFFKRSGQPFNMIERAVTYITAVFVVYLAQMAPGSLVEYDRYSNIFFVMLAIAIGIGFRFAQADRFRITPMDFLVILIAVIVPKLPGIHLQNANLGEGVIKVIILFYGIELVLSNIWRRWNLLRPVICATLLVLAARATLL